MQQDVLHCIEKGYDAESRIELWELLYAKTLLEAGLFFLMMGMENLFLLPKCCWTTTPIFPDYMMNFLHENDLWEVVYMATCLQFCNMCMYAKRNNVHLLLWILVSQLNRIYEWAFCLCTQSFAPPFTQTMVKSGSLQLTTVACCLNRETMDTRFRTCHDLKLWFVALCFFCSSSPLEKMFKNIFSCKHSINLDDINPRVCKITQTQTHTQSMKLFTNYWEQNDSRVLNIFQERLVNLHPLPLFCNVL